MLCIWLENKKLAVLKIKKPKIPPGEVLVRLRLAGICRTDLELVRGYYYYPYRGVLGHEFVGEVVEAPGYPHWLGKRVVGEINVACEKCSACLAGRTKHCTGRSVLGIVDRDGVFAETFCLPVRTLHEVPEGVSDEEAVFTEPLAAAARILEQVQICSSDRVLLVGAGRLGQLIAKVLMITGCELGVLAKYPSQKKLLLDDGITVVDPKQLGARFADLVIEATGTPQGFQIARKAVRPQGTMLLKSTYHDGKAQVDFSSLVVDEITLVGSRCGSFPIALDLLLRHKVNVSSLVTARYCLEQGLRAFEHASQPGALKVLLCP